VGLIREHIRVLPRLEHLDTVKITEVMKKDKKRTSAGLALVMMKEDHGMVKVNDLATEELRDANRELCQIVLMGARSVTVGNGSGGRS